jgi:hypothetical protein
MDQTESKDTHSHKGEMCCSGCCSCACHGAGHGSKRWIVLIIGVVFAFIIGYKLGVMRGLIGREYFGPRGGWNMMYGTVQEIPEQTPAQ